MKKILFISLCISIIVGLSGCQSFWYLFLKCFVDIAPDRFTIEDHHNKLSIPIYSSHPLTKTNNEIEYLILIIHGAGLNAGKSFEIGKKIVESSKIDKSRIMVVAPQFLEGVDPDEKGLLLWDRRWRSGGKSLSNDLNKGLPIFNSYEVIDKMIYVVMKRNPSMRRIIIMGHSAGGQFVLRYAAINNHHETWKRQGVFLQYIVSNSSSYLYLDETRYQFNSNEEIVETSRGELRDCPSYNKYKYGLEELYGYAEKLSPKLIRTRLLTRPIMFLNGATDTDRSWSLDESCEGEAQGENRYKRGLLYKHHLGLLVKNSPESQHIWLEIPDVGHNSTEMFNHPKFIKKLKTLNF